MQEENRVSLPSASHRQVPPSCPTLVDVLRWRALQQPDQQAYRFLDDGEKEAATITYAQLNRQAMSIAAQLQSATAPGERALLLYPPGLAYIAAFMGCLYAGVIAVPAYPPSSSRSLGRIQAIAADAQAQLILTVEQTIAKVARWSESMPELGRMRWIATDDELKDSSEQWQPHRVTPETLTFLQYTSGSTGTPKGVMVSHGNLMHNSALMCERWHHSSASVSVSWLPIFHDMGLIAGVLQPLYAGFPAILMAPTAFIQRPVRWLQAISRYRGTTSWAPNFAYELCTRRITHEERTQLDLRSWQVAGNGAEPIRAETIEQFAHLFSDCGFRREAFTPGYGLAEGTLMVSSSPANVAPLLLSLEKSALEQHHTVIRTEKTPTTQTFIGCGPGAPDQCIAIVHPETRQPCAPGEIGEIWVKGASIAQGYWQRPQETLHTFMASRADTNEGPFLRTGDLGFIHHEELFITGRLKDIIIIRGRNHYPQDIELTVERSHPQLRPGCGAAFTIEIAHEEQLVIIQELMRDYHATDEICRAIRQEVSSLHEVQIYAVILIRYGSIYKTSSGKIQRQACRDAFLQGNLHVIEQDILEHELPDTLANKPLSRANLLALPPDEQTGSLQADIQAHLSRIVHLKREHIALDIPLGVYGLDSLRAVELQMHLEDALDVSLSFVDLLNNTTISDLATTILAQIGTTHSHIRQRVIVRHDQSSSTYPLSSSQEQLWVLYQLEPQLAFYTIPLALHIHGHLNIALLQRCVDEVVQRHEALRTTFQATNGHAVQSIHAHMPVKISVVDLRNLPAGEKKSEELHHQIQEEVQHPFDLTQDILLRIALFWLAPDEYVLLITLHHIISDGWSVGLFLDEIQQCYNALSQKKAIQLPVLPVRYQDYVYWQQEAMQSASTFEHLAYWKHQLEHASILDFPTDRPRPTVQRYRGATLRFSVPATLKQRYQELCSQEGVTLFMAFLAAFQLLLARYTGQEECVLGTVVANRSQTELRNLIGFFVNTLVIRTSIPKDNSYRQLLHMTRKACLDAYAHQELPFSRLVEELRPGRELGRNPLFQILFSWQADMLEKLHIPGVHIAPYEIDGTSCKFDLSMEWTEGSTSLTATVVYNTDLFEEATIKNFITHYQVLLAEIIAHPDAPVAHISLFSPEQYSQKVSNQMLAYQTYELIQEMFTAQVTRTPDALALVFADTCLTYAELDRRANLFAHVLLEHGLQPGALVGICLHRSIELIIGVLGILKANGAYIPLDPAYPPQRLALMISEAALQIVVTQHENMPSLQVTDVPVLYLDSEEMQPQAPLHPQSQEDREQALRMLYMIYTSGSTALPKGAAVYHHSFATLLRWFIDEFHISNHDRVLLTSSFSFDLTQKNIFAPLLVGGILVLHPAQQFEVALLRQSLLEQAITLLNWTPSAFYPLVEASSDVPDLPALRAVFLGGEPISIQRIAPWLAKASTEIINTYGPTECTDVVAFFRLRLPASSGSTNVPIGRAITDTRLLVLNEKQRLLPIGAIGELCITGISVGMGYSNDAASTADKFVPDPFSEFPGQRLYRTGDHVRYRADGELEFIGRVDHQVKLHGYRIELSEIEAILQGHPTVHQCAVILREDIKDRPRLVAYIVPHVTIVQPKTIQAQLRTYMRDKLAAYMLPSHLVVLDALPFTPSGKLDRQALPAPMHFASDETEALIPPRTLLEQILTRLWSDVLAIKEIGTHDNFFSLGGHSLLGTQLISRIHTTLQVTLSLRTLFELPTIAELATWLQTRIRNGSTEQSIPPLKAVTQEGAQPLSFAQERLWFLTQMFPGSASYTTPLPIRLRGNLRMQVLQRCWQEIICRHQVLRTCFVEREGQIIQQVAMLPDDNWPVIDISALYENQRETLFAEMVEQRRQQPFDLTQAPLWRVCMLRLHSMEHVLLITLHHSIFDGWSQSILLNELSTLYKAFSENKPSPLPDLPVQYTDFAIWQRTWLQGHILENQLHYWTEQLRGSKALRLPGDYPRPQVMSEQGASYFFALSPRLSQDLIALSHREEVTVFVTLLVAYQLLLSRWSNQEDIVVGTDSANRTIPEIESLIGFFINILPLRTRFMGQLQFHRVLKQARAMLLEAFAHQDVPFEKIIDALQIERTAGQLPLVNVLFVWQNLPRIAAQSTEIEMSPQIVGVNATKFDLALFMWEEQGRLQAAFNYSTALFKPDTISQLTARFERLLQSITMHPDAVIDTLDMYTEEERQQRSNMEAVSRESQRRKLKGVKRNIIVQ